MARSIRDTYEQFHNLDPKDDDKQGLQRCKFCHERNLKWEELDEGWRLVSKSGEIHRCKTNGQAKLL